jgi:AcrR family transcriptional regulator
MSSGGDETATNSGAGAGTREGHSPLSRERVAETQRARIMAAMVRVVAERGFQDSSIAAVVACAGVSRVTFYGLFKSFDECFLAVLDAAMRRTTALVAEAFAGNGPWQEKAVVALTALLSLLDSDPLLARVCLVEALAAGPAALELRARELEVFKHMVDVAAGQAPGGGRTSLLSAEAVVASVAGILHTRLVTRVAPPFVDLLGPLLGDVLMPYLDDETVAREVERAQRLARTIARERASRPLRPTVGIAIPKGPSNPGAYRMRLCLLYLVDRPGSSNRAIAEGIGITRSGQISKLLARLEHRGLLAKRPGAPGYPNAWSLTPHGRQVAQALADMR